MLIRSVTLNDLSADVAVSAVAQGDLLYRGASKWNNLAAGTARRLLQSGGAGANPFWTSALRESAMSQVGIGLDPSRALDVLDAAAPQLRLTNVAGVGYAELQAISGGSLAFLVNGTEYARLGANGGLAIGTTSPAATLQLSGSRSAAFWGLNGIYLRINGGNTFTDTSSSGAVTAIGVHGIGGATLAASNATTYPDAVLVRIAAAPTAGSNVTITRAWSLTVDAGNVRIGAGMLFGASGSALDAAALVQLDSTTKGLLLPRMTGAQRDAISSPPDGLLIYNTTTGKFDGRAGGAWTALH